MGQGQVSQKQVDIGRDNNVNVGGQQTITNVDQSTNFGPGSQQIVINSGPSSSLVALMERLADEIRRNEHVQNFVAELQLYYEHQSYDGIDGLENKLQHAGRASQISKAIRKKELFVRLLDDFSMFDSAQHVFVHVLSKMEADFDAYVLPHLGQMSDADIDVLINERLITPATHQGVVGAFTLNAAITAGMVYWLAEQCFIRWHA